MANNKPSLSFVYIILVSAISFGLAVLFFWLSNLLSVKMHSILLSVIFLIAIILVGILADILGVAVTAASEVPLHAKAANRIHGATEGVYLIRNADRVANLTGDVVGDIAGTVSGALGIALVAQILIFTKDLRELTLNMLLTAAIASLTVGGKAFGKWVALTYAEDIVFLTGKVLYGISLITGRDFNAKNRKTTK